MVREYVANKKDKNDLGVIALSTKVFESIVFFSLEDNPDVQVCLENPLYHPIVCKTNDGKICLSVDIIIKVGCNVTELSNRILKDIHYAIKQMTGYDNLAIDLNVRGFYL